jgi:tetratricopeptide (TPR) repeat protein
MRLRPVTTILVLMLALIPVLPAWARQNASPIPLAGSAFCSGGVPTAEARAGAQQNVALTFRLAHADPARGISARTSAPGLAFCSGGVPTAERRSETAATAAPSNPGRAGEALKKPLNQIQVFALLAGGVPSHRVTMLVHERGIDFEPTDDYLQEVRLAGGEDELISALKSAKVTRPVTVDPAVQARQAQVQQHVARGAELNQKGQYAEAEQEYRTALLFDPQNPDLYVSLSMVLDNQKKWDDAAAAAREAVRLSPDDEVSHGTLALVLYGNGDSDGAIAEYRVALRMDPNEETWHVGLGNALADKGNWDCPIAEYREALRLNPNNDDTHVDLGIALGKKGDLEAAIAEEREALRLNPNNSSAHFGLGVALEQKGDRRGALEECRAAYVLAPKNATYKQNYERLLQQVNQ